MSKSTKAALYASGGGALAIFVCIAVGVLKKGLFAPPPSGYIGVGLDAWSLPGTVLGAVVFAGGIYYA